jgi:hypothetical protein
MKSLGCFALIGASLLTFSATGCGTNQNPSETSAILPLSGAGGGAFTAYYLGTFALSDCTASKNGRFSFKGGGHASYLQNSNEKGKMSGKRSGSRCVWSGTATLTSKHHPANSVTFSLGLNGSRYHDPCNNALGYVVKRGTGKFAKASGYGTVTFTCNAGKQVDTWSGTLTF